MKIFSAEQIKNLDNLTIEHEPITSIALMERAASAFVHIFEEKFPATAFQDISIFCGTGNNGGDGLAIARILAERHYSITVYFCHISENISLDCQINLNRLPERQISGLYHLRDTDDIVQPEKTDLIIDALLGIGLHDEPNSLAKALFNYINTLGQKIVAVDLPSGLFCDRNTPHQTVHADYTITFHTPKLAFFFPENLNRVGDWETVPIGLHKTSEATISSIYNLISTDLVKRIHKIRQKFDHKGTFGHALIIAGSYGKVGAAILAARACLRSGAGLLTIHAPKCAYEILQISLPEAMVSLDFHEYYFTRVKDLSPYKAIGIGCGISTQMLTANALEYVLKNVSTPLVLDADALNLMAVEQKLLKLLPKKSIITPHPKEFERLFGASINDFEMLILQIAKSKEYGIYIVLKRANTCITTPEGVCYFNDTGNPGMATAGSGDALTGIITGLLSQNYSPLEAAVLGVYVHGLAGDMAAKKLGHEALLAGDIIDNLGNAFSEVSK
ncbi:MAG: NAD(P)H-hydrate dehydratase [Saprospiraceae bacterium]